jgi:phosphoribosylaminoimidazole-succinocarboxamide synthase
VAHVSDLKLRHLYTGKVRDLYEVDESHLLMVASDRLSAFDVVMNEAVPQKGRVLTGLTNFWVDDFGDDITASLVSCDPDVIDVTVPGFASTTQWHGRSMLVRRAEMLPLECIVRGRLAGSSFAEYSALGTVHGMPAPKGMKLTDAFPEPRFTPSTKADAGHDENIDLTRAASIIGDDTLREAQTLCLDLFARAAATMASAGLILADTKFELGFVDGALVVCDEILTPDSSRIWPADDVHSGVTPPSFDKQPLRDWLSSMPWDRTPPPPTIPDDIVSLTSARYVAAYERVTGRSIDDWYGASS